MEVKLCKKLANGANGTVYLCMYNDKYAIAKMEKFDGEISSKNTHTRQIIFDEFAKQHPDKFMTLVFSGIVNNCKFKQPVPDNIKKWPKIHRDNWLKTQQFTKCSLLIYKQILCGTLREIRKIWLNMNSHELRDKLNTLKFAIFKHLKKSIELMHKAGYYHRDIHAGNIMYNDPSIKNNTDLIKATKNFRINPDKFYIIDYGQIYHTKFEKNNTDDINNKYSVDLYPLIQALCDNPINYYIRLHNIQISDDKQILKFLENHPIYPKLKKYLPAYIRKDMNILKEANFLHQICCFVDYDIYCESMGVSHVQKKLDLMGYKSVNAMYYLKIISKLKLVS